MEYYAKSPNSQRHRETVKEHLQNVAALAREYGEPLGLGEAAELAGRIHDFGKYSSAFQDVLKGLRTGIDHAIGGACFLEGCYRGNPGVRPVVEAVNGHHDGLVAYGEVKEELNNMADDAKHVRANAGKAPSIEGAAQLTEAIRAFRRDFPDFKPPQLCPPPRTELESMLYTRMLFSCLVDADYTDSAANDDVTYMETAKDDYFEPRSLLENLYTYRDYIRQSSTADRTLNAYRNRVFEQCGRMGD